MEWKIRWWGCYKPVLKLWMILLDYIENAGECESVRRVDDDSFLIVLVGLAVQSTDMCTSSIAEIEMSRTRRVNTGMEEKIVYYESSGNRVKFGFWKWNKFGGEWAIEVRW